MFITGTMGFGVSRVSGRSRVPSPPTRTTACTGLSVSSATWSKPADPSAPATRQVRRGTLVSRPQEQPLELILKKSGSRCTIKRRLLMAGKLRNQCDFCGLSEWHGQPISIQIDHINGVRDDHRLENLRMLCPNCHSQTETYAGKKRRHRT